MQISISPRTDAGSRVYGRSITWVIMEGKRIESVRIHF